VRVAAVMSVAWAPSTLEMYGAGLLLFHAICNARSIPEPSRAPASSELLCVFLAKLPGSYSISALTNYLAGIQAWHHLYWLPWHLDSTQQQLMVRGAAAMLFRLDVEQPPSLRITRAKRPPLTIAILSRVRTHLDLSVSLDAAVYACATALLHGIARSGEFTVTKLSAFNPQLYVTISNVRRGVTDQDSNSVTIIHLPRTKSAPNGKDVYWGKQLDDTDPDDALANHEAVNCPQPNEHPFTYEVLNRSGCINCRLLTEDAFIRRFQAASKGAGITDNYSNHCFRIGGTLEYLLQSLPFEVVKVKGRWLSDAFCLY
ncbi:uncharacterized protein PHACADRAFT_76616, partial [Phanerochaete carnosa HHB-10118-sp]